MAAPVRTAAVLSVVTLQAKEDVDGFSYETMR